MIKAAVAVEAINPTERRPKPIITTPSACPQKNEKAWSATAEARAPGATSVTWAWKVLWSM
jgi:hypothetical protein